MKNMKEYTKSEIMVKYKRHLNRVDNKARNKSLMGGTHYPYVGQLKCYKFFGC